MIEVTRYDGQHGPYMVGLLKSPTPKRLEHNLHMIEQNAAELFFPMPIVRPRYLLMHVPFSVANLGLFHYELPNLFNAPDRYLPKQENEAARNWLVGTRFARFKFKLIERFGSPGPEIVDELTAEPWINVAWDMVNPLGENAIPGGNFGTFNAGISAGRGISTVDAFTPIDVTDLGDGRFDLTVSLLDRNDPTADAAAETIRIRKEGIGNLWVE